MDSAFLKNSKIHTAADSLFTCTHIPVHTMILSSFRRSLCFCFLSSSCLNIVSKAIALQAHIHSLPRRSVSCSRTFSVFRVSRKKVLQLLPTRTSTIAIRTAPNILTSITTFMTSSSTAAAAAAAASSSSSSSGGTDDHADATNTFRQDNNNNDDDDNKSCLVLPTGYLNATDAYNLDVDLMSTPGFTLEQLMELAGLSVAQVVYEVTPKTSSSASSTTSTITTLDAHRPKTLIVCGPGNNGGDGLVAARHLALFGHDVVVVYPKRSKREVHYANLVQQCHDLQIPILDDIPSDVSNNNNNNNYSVIVDAIFGFSFTGIPREPFASILNRMMELQSIHGIPIVSVDVPSGWNVNEGDVSQSGFMPQVLISLTAPKLCAKQFITSTTTTGRRRRRRRHFCGGRFLPPALAQKYNISMPPYPGTSQYMEFK